MSQGYAVFGEAMAGILVLVIGAVTNALVAVQLWAWFMVTVFGLPPITIPMALGIRAALMVLLSYTTIEPQHFSVKGDRIVVEEKSFKAKIVSGLVFTLMALLVGWIAHLFL